MSIIKFIFYGLRKPIVILDCTCIIIWTILNVFNDRLLASIASTIASNNPITNLIFIYIIMVVCWAGIEWIGDVLSLLNAEDIEVSTRRYYISRMYKCKPSILRNYNTGYISGLVDKLAYRREDICGMLFEEMPLSTVYLISVCVIMGILYHWIYAVVIFGVSAIAVIFRILINKKNLPNIDALRDAEAENVQLFLDSGTNINTVQKLQAMDFIKDKFRVSIDKCRKTAFNYTKIDEIGFTGFKLISYTIFPICAVIQLLYPETVQNTVEFYAFLVMIQLRILHMVKSYSNFLKCWMKYSSPYRKLENILSDINQREKLDSQEANTVEIKNCDYSYEYEDINNKELKKTVRVQIPYFKMEKGDVICIHGESGQGKTTLLNILSGEIETNNVYINGNNTTKRLNCVFIAQDTEIFDMTIKDNLKLSNINVTDEELLQMFDSVGLKSWFLSQPDGFDTRLGERGVFVSTGQRQRLNLIRGLLIPDGEIYLLDEPTSNVDSETEEKMIELIKEKLQGKTVIIVTHKPKIMKICNKSYKFENGILGKEQLI